MQPHVTRRSFLCVESRARALLGTTPRPPGCPAQADTRTQKDPLPSPWQQHKLPKGQVRTETGSGKPDPPRVEDPGRRKACSPRDGSTHCPKGFDASWCPDALTHTGFAYFPISHFFLQATRSADSYLGWTGAGLCDQEIRAGEGASRPSSGHTRR